MIILQETLTVPVGFPMQLAVQTEPADVVSSAEWAAEPEGALTWEEGMLTASEEGDAVITFNVNGVSTSCQVHAVRPSKLPAGLTSLEEQALSGLPIAYLELPASLTEIADDAFEDCDVVLIVYEGSYAEKWAEEKGKEYLTINEYHQ